MPLQGGGPREPATRGGRRQTRDGDSTGRDVRWRLLLGWPVRPAPRRSVRQAAERGSGDRGGPRVQWRAELFKGCVGIE